MVHMSVNTDMVVNAQNNILTQLPTHNNIIHKWRFTTDETVVHGLVSYTHTQSTWLL